MGGRGEFVSDMGDTPEGEVAEAIAFAALLNVSVHSSRLSTD